MASEITGASTGSERETDDHGSDSASEVDTAKRSPGVDVAAHLSEGGEDRSSVHVAPRYRIIQKEHNHR